MYIKTCINCGNEFNVKNYRNTTAKFCSYRCAGKYRKNIEYKCKHELIKKNCLLCGNIFEVENLSAKKNRKYCSKECMKLAQGNKLRSVQYLSNLSPKRKKGRTVLTKVCVICKSEYKVINGNFRQNTCGRECGIILRSRNRKIKITEEDFKKAIIKSKNTYELCDILGCSLYTVIKRSKEFNIPYRKNTKRVDGYWGYGTKNNHRRIYEEFHNIKLLPKQSVHHLDGNKDNNKINNLFKCDSVSDHLKIHRSIEKIGFDLYKKGYVGFNTRDKNYYLKLKKVK